MLVSYPSPRLTEIYRTSLAWRYMYAYVNDVAGPLPEFPVAHAVAGPRHVGRFRHVRSAAKTHVATECPPFELKALIGNNLTLVPLTP
jgi:hypothetical protein